MPDPLDRLTLAQQKIDELFGPNYAKLHPELLVVILFAAMLIMLLVEARDAHRRRR